MDDDFSDLEECWRDLVPPGPSRHLFSTSTQRVTTSQLQRWVGDLVEEDSSSLLAIPYTSTSYREAAYRDLFQGDVMGATSSPQDWLDSGVYPALEKRVANLTGGTPWTWIIKMLRAPVFLAEEPLRSMVDDAISPATGLFYALWDLRLRMQEGSPAKENAAAILRWLTGKSRDADLNRLRTFHIDRNLVSAQERAEMLLFLLALARQNEVLGKVVLPFDGLDQALRFSQTKRRDLLKPLTDLCMQVERWGKLRSGVGLALTYATNQEGVLASLKQFAPRLHHKVQLVSV